MTVTLRSGAFLIRATNKVSMILAHVIFDGDGGCILKVLRLNTIGFFPNSEWQKYFRCIGIKNICSK